MIWNSLFGPARATPHEGLLEPPCSIGVRMEASAESASATAGAAESSEVIRHHNFLERFWKPATVCHLPLVVTPKAPTSKEPRRRSSIPPGGRSGNEEIIGPIGPAGPTGATGATGATCATDATGASGSYGTGASPTGIPLSITGHNTGAAVTFFGPTSSAQNNSTVQPLETAIAVEGMKMLEDVNPGFCLHRQSKCGANDRLGWPLGDHSWVTVSMLAYCPGRHSGTGRASRAGLC